MTEWATLNRQARNGTAIGLDYVGHLLCDAEEIKRSGTHGLSDALIAAHVREAARQVLSHRNQAAMARARCLFLANNRRPKHRRAS